METSSSSSRRSAPSPSPWRLCPSSSSPGGSGRAPDLARPVCPRPRGSRPRLRRLGGRRALRLSARARRGRRRDARVCPAERAPPARLLALAGLATFARVQFAVLPVCFLAAVLVVGLRERRVRSVLREQALVLAAVLIPVLAFVAVGPSRALGFYKGILELDVGSAEMGKWLGADAMLLAYAAGVVLAPGALLGLWLALRQPRSRRSWPSARSRPLRRRAPDRGRRLRSRRRPHPGALLLLRRAAGRDPVRAVRLARLAASPRPRGARRGARPPRRPRAALRLRRRGRQDELAHALRRRAPRAGSATSPPRRHPRAGHHAPRGRARPREPAPQGSHARRAGPCDRRLRDNVCGRDLLQPGERRADADRRGGAVLRRHRRGRRSRDAPHAVERARVASEYLFWNRSLDAVYLLPGAEPPDSVRRHAPHDRSGWHPPRSRQGRDELPASTASATPSAYRADELASSPVFDLLASRSPQRLELTSRAGSRTAGSASAAASSSGRSRPPAPSRSSSPARRARRPSPWSSPRPGGPSARWSSGRAGP